jgi:pilus assembly protein CpaE
VIDTASTVDENLLAFLDASDQLIQVVTYEHAALHQARQLTGTLAAAGFPAQKIRYLVNRSDSMGGMPKTAMEETLGRRADYEVVSDGLLVVEANNRAEPFIRLAPDAQITQDVRRIAARLTSEAAAPRPVNRHGMAQTQAAAGAP